MREVVGKMGSTRQDWQRIALVVGLSFGAALGSSGCDRFGSKTDDDAGKVTRPTSASASVPTAKPIDEARAKKLLANLYEEGARSELVSMGPGVALLVEKDIQGRILDCYNAPLDKQWGIIVEIYQRIEVLGDLGKPADENLERLCSDLKGQSKLGKKYDKMFVSTQPKICAAIEKHGSTCACTK